MKFVKEVTGEKMAIPAAALKLCGFENGDKAELHALPSAAIILKQKMTAMEVIQAMPPITRVWYQEKSGQRLTLEQECLRSGTLPSIAYGRKSCSLKHKVAPQERFCNQYQPCLDTWTRGEKVVKFIGYDAGEERRRQGAVAHDLLDKKYQKQYPLMDWGWRRTDCIQAIQSAGLPLPGKSSCFFCPSMKRREIRTLYHRYPDLLARALAIEETAMPNLISVKGLGRDWAWRDFITADENQMVIPGAFSDEDLPCACRLESEKPELP